MLMQKFIESQRYLSSGIDAFMNDDFRIDGNRYFIDVFAPKFLQPGQTIVDVGGGKRPFIDGATKKKLQLTIIGLDIDQQELANAPEGIYDEVICADICQYRGQANADVVICQAVLEHVKDVTLAFRGLASILKPGGLALIFVPSRNALYARLSMIIPEKLKSQVLQVLFPQRAIFHGFPSFYDRCTPRDFKALATQYGFQVEECSYHYISRYFSFFFPLYLLWRLWSLWFYCLAKEQAADTFSMALRKIGY